MEKVVGDIVPNVYEIRLAYIVTIEYHTVVTTYSQ